MFWPHPSSCLTLLPGHGHPAIRTPLVPLIIPLGLIPPASTDDTFATPPRELDTWISAISTIFSTVCNYGNRAPGTCSGLLFIRLCITTGKTMTLLMEWISGTAAARSAHSKRLDPASATPKGRRPPNQCAALAESHQYSEHFALLELATVVNKRRMCVTLSMN